MGEGRRGLDRREGRGGVFAVELVKMVIVVVFVFTGGSVGGLILFIVLLLSFSYHY